MQPKSQLLESSGLPDARARYLSLTKTPREQLNEFKKRNKPTVILKMKPVHTSSASTPSGQPIILRQPAVAIDQGGRLSVRQKSNPQTQKINRQMLTNYPFFFTPEKPAKLSEAPEVY